MSWLEVNTYRILVDYYVHFNTFRAKILKQNLYEKANWECDLLWRYWQKQSWDNLKSKIKVTDFEDVERETQNQIRYVQAEWVTFIHIVQTVYKMFVLGPRTAGVL